MFIWLALQLQSLLQELHSKSTPRHIALGFALGSLAGWVPFNIIYSSIILLLLYILNVNTGFGVIAIGVVSIFSYALDPIAGILGHWILCDVSFLHPLWTFLFNIPIFPYTRFNNSVMMGSFVLAILLFLPVYFLIRWAVIQYRQRWHDQLEKTRIMRYIQASKVVTWYMRVRG